MPYQDGTGPMGQGPMTGRGFGPCGRGFRRGFGRGMGRGFGRGFGFRRAFDRAPIDPYLDRANSYFDRAEPVSFSKTEEKKILETELKEIDLEKKEIEKRLKELLK